MKKPKYAEFYDERLVSLYDTFNALGADSAFFCDRIEDLSPSSIVDLGCGTGLLTCELAGRGYKIIGIDPSTSMLDVARSKPSAKQIRWIEGDHTKLKNIQTDLVLMTSHVAQFFLDDSDWQSMLRTVHNSLGSKGHIIFDSRNPLTTPWENWTRTKTSKRSNTEYGEVEQWYELNEVKENRINYNINYLFHDSNEEIISHNELIYRSKEEIELSMRNAGFSHINVYGYWDSSPFAKSSPEMIFVANKA